MGKRAFLAFFLSLLVIIGYNYYQAQKYPPQPEQLAQVQTEEITPSPIVSSAQPVFVSRAHSVEGAKDILVETDLVSIVITSSGARIKSCQLKGYPEEKISAESVQKQIAEIAQGKNRATPQTKALLERKQAKLEILLEKLTQQPEMAELVSLPAILDAEFSPAIILPDAEETSLALNTALYQCPEDTLILSQEQPEGQLDFVYTDTQGRRVKKSYSFSNSNYNVGLDINFQGWQKYDFPAHYFLLYYGPDVGLPQAQTGRRMYGYQGPVSCFQTGQQAWTQKEKYARHEQDTFVRREHKDKGSILWTGLENKYFLTALIPRQPVESVVIEKNRLSEQKVALTVPWQGAGPYNPYNFTLYLGPKKEKRLKEAGVSLEKVIDYGFFGPIARFIYQALVFFSRWTHNFGWAIVLLCLVTKIVFYPLTHRSFESMQKMQREMRSLQPEMQALREQYKDSPQKLNKQIMELYRKKGINPLASCQSGCFPLLLQMPVFFALYGVLYNSIELRGTPFLGWITDLSAKDPYYILPILMGASMFMQQKLTGMGTAAGGAQQEQAKMMAVLMPVMLTWIFATLPSGVVLYWLTFNIVTSLQQLLIRRVSE